MNKSEKMLYYFKVLLLSKFYQDACVKSVNFVGRRAGH